MLSTLEAIPELLAAEREKALREAAKVAETTFIGDTFSPSTRISEAILSLIDTETDPQPDLSGTSEPQDAHKIANRIASSLFTAGWHEAAEYALSDWMHGQIMAALGIEQEGET